MPRTSQTTKKRARELKHDKFRDATMGAFDRVGGRLEGRGRTILYLIGALALAAALFGVYRWWDARRTDEARAALGHAIEIAGAQVTSSPDPASKSPTFPTERERAQKALDEFQKVAGKYGDPYDDIARYMAATQLLTVERQRGLSELEALSKSGTGEVAANAKFALAQARESDGQLDPAASLYQELLKQSTDAVPADTLNLRLASVYEKQGKKSEAADMLFRMVKEAREAKGKDGKPARQSKSATDAATRLEALDPARYAQLPEQPDNDGPM